VTAGLRYTGHPLVDAGVAGITAHFGRATPPEVTEGDLAEWSDRLLDWYGTEAARTSLAVLFTTNFPWLSPARAEASRAADTEEILTAWRSGPVGEAPCAFCAAPALAGGCAAPVNGMAQRDLVPLLEGRPRMNFSPGGRAGVRVCGRCVLALQSLTVAAPLVSGKVVVADTPDPQLRLAIARIFLRQGVERMARSRELGDKVSEKGSATQRVIDALEEVYSAHGEAPAAPVTVYWLSNSGQAPTVSVRAMSEPLVDWIRRAQAARLAPAWHYLRGRSARAKVDSFRQDVAELPEELLRFWRFHIGPCVADLAHGAAGVPPVSELVEALWREVVGVTEERVQSIRDLASRLAEEVERGGPRLGREMFARNVRLYREVRDLLMRANNRRLRSGRDPLIGLDDFLRVFDEGPDEVPRVDWRLAWDLVTLGTAERLYAAGWFEGHRDDLGEVAEEEDGAADGGDRNAEEEEDTWHL
jgi:CRISPR-associated protein Cst1